MKGVGGTIENGRHPEMPECEGVDDDEIAQEEHDGEIYEETDIKDQRSNAEDEDLENESEEMCIFWIC